MSDAQESQGVGPTTSSRRSTRGYTFHRHKCPRCGKIWRHSDQAMSGCSAARHYAAHRCPDCGAYQSWKYLPESGRRENQ